MEIDKNFIQLLREDTIENCLNLYMKMIRTKDPESVKNPHWKLFLKAIKVHGVAGEKAFEHIARQIMCDSIASLLGILDGSSGLVGMEGDFSLFYEGVKINDELLNIFWELEE